MFLTIYIASLLSVRLHFRKCSKEHTHRWPTHTCAMAKQLLQQNVWQSKPDLIKHNALHIYVSLSRQATQGT